MEAIIYSVLILFVFFAIEAFSKLHNYSQEQKLRNLVSWCIIKRGQHEFLSNAPDLPLWSYISNAQIHLNLPQDYRISGDREWSMVKEIIEEYRKDLVLSYFKGYLKLIKSKYVLNGNDYFMYSLQSFLNDHQCDCQFLGYEMHKERLEYKKYGSWGGPIYDATYSLTDFAVAFHKLYYIAYLFCKNNKAINPREDAFQNEKFISEILNTKQIQVSVGL